MLTGLFLGRGTADHLRRNAVEDDEGLPLILLLKLIGVALRVRAIFMLLRLADEAGTRAGAIAVAGGSARLADARHRPEASWQVEPMRWHPRGYGGERRSPDRVKQDGWQEQGLLAVSLDDERLSWPERELVRRLGEKLYGKREEPPHR